MKRILVNLFSIAALSTVMVNTADASGGFRHWHRDGPRVGLYFGDPFWGPGPYWDAYPPYTYYTPPPVIIQQQAPVYVQREPAAPAQAPQQMWYYCPNPAGYYPYVQSCPQQWIPVDPRSVPPVQSAAPQQ